jgi:hypothetical protein
VLGQLDDPYAVEDTHRLRLLSHAGEGSVAARLVAAGAAAS